MNTQQSKALRLANDNEICALAWPKNSIAHKIHQDTAAELRHLHAANLDCMEWYEAVKSERDELLEALKAMVALDEDQHQRHQGDEDVCREVQQARAAIAKAGGAA